MKYAFHGLLAYQSQERNSFLPLGFHGDHPQAFGNVTEPAFVTEQLHLLDHSLEPE